MNPLAVLGFCLGFFMGCQSAEMTRAMQTDDTSTPSLVEPIAPGVWMHSTVRDVNGFGRVVSNGIVVASGDAAVLVDTGWGEDPERETQRILAEAQHASGATVRHAVFTHHHDDSVAGHAVLREAGVPVHATEMTADLMVADGWTSPDSVLRNGDTWTLAYGSRQLEVFYAGPGHTVDNVVVYVPSARVLYTGCLVRPGASDSLGNTADADLEHWVESVARVRERYRGRVDVVVPSHGPPGGAELLDHTIELVETHRERAVGG